MIYTKVIEDLLQADDGSECLNMVVAAAVNNFDCAESPKEKAECFQTLVYLDTEMDKALEKKCREIKTCVDVGQRLKKEIRGKGAMVCLVPQTQG